MIVFIIVLREQSIKPPPTTKLPNPELNFDSTSESPSPAKTKDNTPVTIKIESPANWLYFNKDYQNPGRNFRFKYPSALEIIDVDSHYVQLKYNGEIVFMLESVIPFTEIPGTKTQDEQFELFYSKRYKDHTDPMYQRISIGNDSFLYKVTRNSGNKTYLGEIKGNGIEIVDYGKLPENVVFDIIKSIESANPN